MTAVVVGTNSGSADVVPLVASEKNVEACVVSSLFENVGRLRREPLAPAAAHLGGRVMPESPSLLFSSMVENAVDPRRAGGDEGPAVRGRAGRLRQVDVAAARSACRAAGVADGNRGASPDFLLHVGVVDVREGCPGHAAPAASRSRWRDRTAGSGTSGW